jgi:hypothetical protein
MKALYFRPSKFNYFLPVESFYFLVFLISLFQKNISLQEFNINDYHHLWVDCLDNVGSLTSHNPIGLQGLLRG